MKLKEKFQSTKTITLQTKWKLSRLEKLKKSSSFFKILETWAFHKTTITIKKILEIITDFYCRYKLNYNFLIYFYIIIGWDYLKNMNEFEFKINLATATLEELELERRRVQRLETFKPKSLIWVIFFVVIPIIIIIFKVNERNKLKKEMLEDLDRTINTKSKKISLNK